MRTYHVFWYQEVSILVEVLILFYDYICVYVCLTSGYLNRRNRKNENTIFEQWEEFSWFSALVPISYQSFRKYIYTLFPVSCCCEILSCEHSCLIIDFANGFWVLVASSLTYYQLRTIFPLLLIVASFSLAHFALLQSRLRTRYGFKKLKFEDIVSRCRPISCIFFTCFRFPPRPIFVICL